jgi:hypothetical protein
MRRLPLWIALLAIAIAASASADGAEDAEALARTLYYEGVPAGAARALDAQGIGRLGEMLADPAEAAHHGNIVSVLGLSGHPDAFGLLRAYASTAPSGEVDRATFRARSRLGEAMGRLAQDDPRALAWLLADARRAKTPTWSHRHHRGAHLRALLEEQTLTGLALSGSPGARPILESAAATPGQDVAAKRRRAHGHHALEVHGRQRGEPGNAR